MVPAIAIIMLDDEHVVHDDQLSEVHQQSLPPPVQVDPELELELDDELDPQLVLVLDVLEVLVEVQVLEVQLLVKNDDS